MDAVVGKSAKSGKRHALLQRKAPAMAVTVVMPGRGMAPSAKGAPPEAPTEEVATGHDAADTAPDLQALCDRMDALEARLESLEGPDEDEAEDDPGTDAEQRKWPVRAPDDEDE